MGDGSNMTDVDVEEESEERNVGILGGSRSGDFACWSRLPHFFGRWGFVLISTTKEEIFEVGVVFTIR
jgi:hypothetical protein